MRQPLNSPAIPWEFKARNPQVSVQDDFQSQAGWLPATVPGTVHTDLLAAGQIPEPFYGQNEAELQWIGETEWLYRASFTPNADALALPHADLTFGSLDTIADVWFNAQHVLHSENMFVPARVSIKSHLKNGENTIWISFASALKHGQELEAQYRKREVWNGDPSRVYVRKAQYHYGWDWGPCFITAGIWQDAALEAYSARISEVHPQYSLSDDFKTADLTVEVSLAGTGEVQVELVTPGGQVLPLEPGQDGRYHLKLKNPELWWPAGYGAQPLYTLRVRLDGSDVTEQRLGLRRAELVQEHDAHGQSFYFRVNGVDIFCGGVNWIPDDLFLHRVTEPRYRERLKSAVDAHMVMIRVWGGGIYEQDVFYDLCDELGLLVWQDFMFGCGIYPAHPEFVATVESEAQDNIRRLRHHPSLVLWCGNNEDYQLAQALGYWGPEKRPDAGPEDFPAQEIYEKNLPAIVAELDPGRPYVPSSAWSPDDVYNQQHGDRHTWEVWGNSQDYRLYPELGGRFVSEFGMCAAPAAETVETFCPPAEWDIHSATFMAHNKSNNGVVRLDEYLKQNYGPVSDLNEYLYATQWLQAEALQLAVSVWRGRWGHAGARECAGALVWQLNDCWPVTSWALIDSELRRKPAYYVLRRLLAPLSVGLARQDGQLRAWVVSSAPDTISGEVHLETFGLGGEKRSEQILEVRIAPNSVTPLDWQQADSEQQVVFARLLVGGEEISRFALWPERTLARDLPSAEVNVSRVPGGVSVQATGPARGVWLSVPAPTEWSDNWLDLRPGEVVRLRAELAPETSVQVKSAGAS